MTHMTIPEIRARLFEIADELGHDELHFLAEQTFRKPSIRKRTPNRHPPLTEEEKDRIREYAARNPQSSLQQIAVVFKTNNGRISEVLNGKKGG